MIGSIGNPCIGLGSKCGHSSAKEDKCLIDGRATTERPCPKGEFKMQIFRTDIGEWHDFLGYEPGTMIEIKEESE